MTEYDRRLVDLISELTDCGMVWPLSDAVDVWGRAHTKRVIADGFAVIRCPGTNLDDCKFVPAEDPTAVIDHLRKTDDYVILAGPWAAIGPEDAPSLIFRYAADEPDAVAEVRSLHAERRAALCP